jgi:hypothetical protein
LAVHADLITGRRRMLEVLMQRQDRSGDTAAATSQ